ncbi:MAG: DinB family protein [Ginsengibacter sp.]
MKAKKTDPLMISAIIQDLIDLVEKGNAHASLDHALEDMPFSLLGERPENLPYSVWQLADHIRIAQWDILEFCRDAKHLSPKWPDGYWPKETAPESPGDWQKCINTIKTDRKTFIELIKNAGDALVIPFEYGSGQSLFKEALVLADHNSYHSGEIIILRRLLKVWN